MHVWTLSVSFLPPSLLPSLHASGVEPGWLVLFRSKGNLGREEKEGEEEEEEEKEKRRREQRDRR